jgi:hypothetical protein
MDTWFVRKCNETGNLTTNTKKTVDISCDGVKKEIGILYHFLIDSYGIWFQHFTVKISYIWNSF